MNNMIRVDLSTRLDGESVCTYMERVYGLEVSSSKNNIYKSSDNSEFRLIQVHTNSWGYPTYADFLPIHN